METKAQLKHMGMKTKQVVTLAVGISLVVLGSALASSLDNDSYYVSLGSQNGYYVVRPDSQLRRQLGYENAPYVDTADPLYHGNGADALAFRFNRKGVLVQAPAYIVSARPNDFFTSRIGSLTRGRSNERDVEALFGDPSIRDHRSDGFVLYYRQPVYNAFEDDFGK
jgi:hypothetical protein